MAELKVTITEEERKICEDFASKSVSTNIKEYERRNQSNVGKVELDISIGKMAEIGVYKILNKAKLKCSYPDFEIYDKYHKTFDADLTIDKYDIHVKSQLLSQSKSFGESWLFQKNDKLTYIPTERDVICLCIVSSNEVIIKKILLANNLTGLYGIPKSPKLKDNKHALYYKDIENLKFKI